MCIDDSFAVGILIDDWRATGDHAGDCDVDVCAARAIDFSHCAGREYVGSFGSGAACMAAARPVQSGISALVFDGADDRAGHCATAGTHQKPRRMAAVRAHAVSATRASLVAMVRRSFALERSGVSRRNEQSADSLPLGKSARGEMVERDEAQATLTAKHSLDGDNHPGNRCCANRIVANDDCPVPSGVVCVAADECYSRRTNVCTDDRRSHVFIALCTDR